MNLVFVIDIYMNRLYYKKPQCTSSSSTFVQVGFIEAYFPLTIFCVGLVLAVFGVIFEILVDKYLRKFTKSYSRKWYSLFRKENSFSIHLDLESLKLIFRFDKTCKPHQMFHMKREMLPFMIEKISVQWLLRIFFCKIFSNIFNMFCSISPTDWVIL